MKISVTVSGNNLQGLRGRALELARRLEDRLALQPEGRPALPPVSAPQAPAPADQPRSAGST